MGRGDDSHAHPSNFRHSPSDSYRYPDRCASNTSAGKQSDLSAGPGG